MLFSKLSEANSVKDTADTSWDRRSPYVVYSR